MELVAFIARIIPVRSLIDGFDVSFAICLDVDYLAIGVSNCQASSTYSGVVSAILITSTLQLSWVSLGCKLHAMIIDDKPVIIWLNTHLSLLSHLQQRIFILRYGLNGERRHSLEEIGEELMLTRGEITAEEAEVFKIAMRNIKKRPR